MDGCMDECVCIGAAEHDEASLDTVGVDTRIAQQCVPGLPVPGRHDSVRAVSVQELCRPDRRGWHALLGHSCRSLGKLWLSTSEAPDVCRGRWPGRMPLRPHAPNWGREVACSFSCPKFVPHLYRACTASQENRAHLLQRMLRPRNPPQEDISFALSQPA
eukprot:363790-Chlamydomonas_euryale.AAC.2